MGVMLDTSALIGLHEADLEVRTFLAGVLEQHDDGATPKVHMVTLGELWTGVLAVGAPDDPDNPRLPVLETALSLDVETIDAEDAATFGALTRATNRAMSHNDRWICAAAIRTRTTLITQDDAMVTQLGRYFQSLDLIEGLRSYVKVVYVPRDPADLAGTEATRAVDTLRFSDEIADLLSRLDPRGGGAEVAVRPGPGRAVDAAGGRRSPRVEARACRPDREARHRSSAGATENG